MIKGKSINTNFNKESIIKNIDFKALSQECKAQRNSQSSPNNS